MESAKAIPHKTTTYSLLSRMHPIVLGFWLPLFVSSNETLL